MSRVRTQSLLGALLVVIYTGLIASADGITKVLAGGYGPVQIYALSGAVVVLLCRLADRLPGQRRGFTTSCPRATALRSLATVIAAICFFQAFRLLPFAEVFVFIGLMPLLAGAMSGALLNEPVRPAAWLALLAGFAGMLFLFPRGLATVSVGHLLALMAAVAGTFSMTMARYIGRYEAKPLVQVFYPNLCLCLLMLLLVPFAWQPMSAGDVGWVLAYALLLFAARWLLVVALRLLASYAVTPLMNLQFIWMAVIGALGFGEYPPLTTYVGGLVVVGSGLYLVWDQFAPRGPQTAAQPTRPARLRTDP
jgi:drug/metabolite transporter (DMT)-like permease